MTDNQSNTTDSDPTQPTDKYDQLWDDWTDSYGFWHAAINRQNQQIPWLRNKITHGLDTDRDAFRLLDVGCGEGHEVHEALDDVTVQPHIVANDISQDVLDTYHETNSPYIERLHCGDFTDLPRTLMGEFDVMLFSHCLHNTDIEQMLIDFEPYLAQDGRILVLLESADSTIQKLRDQFWEPVHGTPHPENTGEDVCRAVMRIRNCDIRVLSPSTISDPPTESEADTDAATPVVFEETNQFDFNVDIDPIDYTATVTDYELRQHYIPFGLRADTDQISDTVMSQATTMVKRAATHAPMGAMAIPQRTVALTLTRAD